MFSTWFKRNILHLIMKYYGVRAGRKPGVYESWKECETQVLQFRGARFRKFSTYAEAEHFVKEGTDFKAEEKLMCVLFADELNSNQNDSNSIQSESAATSTSSTFRKRKLESITSNKINKVAKLEESSTSSSCAHTNDDKSNSCPVVYTDGACSKNGRKGSLAGYGVWWGKEHPLNLSCKLKGIQTNQRAEIAAINAAIKQAVQAGYKSVLIKTDSQFVINCMTKWVSRWKSRNWTKADGKPVVHKVEFMEMLENMKQIKVNFEHVAGHRGIYGNEMADQLAVAGAKLP